MSAPSGDPILCDPRNEIPHLSDFLAGIVAGLGWEQVGEKWTADSGSKREGTRTPLASFSSGFHNKIPYTMWQKQHTRISLEAGSPRSVPTVSVPGEASLPGLQMAALSLFSYGREREISLLLQGHHPFA